MKSLPALLVLPFFILSACSKTPDTLVNEYDQSEMDAAMAKAKATVGEFIEALEADDGDSFSIKVAITDPNGTEHFWIVDVSYKDDTFSGEIGNDPGIVKNVEYGQEWTTPKGEISDWMITKGEKIHGAFTLEPLLDSYPQDEADDFRSKLVR